MGYVKNTYIVHSIYIVLKNGMKIMASSKISINSETKMPQWQNLGKFVEKKIYRHVSQEK